MSFKNVFLIKIALALLIILTLSNYLILIWRNPVGYYLLILCASLLGGIVIADVEKGLLIMLIIYVFSCFIFVFLNILSMRIFDAAAEEIDIVVYIATTELAKQSLITLPILVFICLYGCFLGKSLKEQ